MKQRRSVLTIAVNRSPRRSAQLAKLNSHSRRAIAPFFAIPPHGARGLDGGPVRQDLAGGPSGEVVGEDLLRGARKSRDGHVPLENASLRIVALRSDLYRGHGVDGTSQSTERKPATLAKLDRLRKTLGHEEADRVPLSDFFWGQDPAPFTPGCSRP